MAMATSTYGVHPTLPPLSLTYFNPFANPPVLSPPEADPSLAHPFNISPEFYSNLLHVAWPLAIASVYAVTVQYMNGVNARREFKPWAISRSSPFYFFVLLHNIGLAIFSGWVLVGMLNTIANVWPGWRGEYGLAGAADALCKMHGPRRLGSAATFSETTSNWSFTDLTMKLDGLEPDSTDVGRIWNEGLAYYGFLFYLSKFYEVVDTAIILAKGKKSSGLQTFHHAGAMLCMWAGIRYMSPPIWMFTCINSGIHTMMYTYYALTSLTIPIPKALKSVLTSLQIVQIVFGGSYALAHLFVAYDIPVMSPVKIIHNLSTLIPSGASSVSSAAISVATSANIEAWLKKLALRAAGEEGLAENVRNYKGETFGIDALHAAEVERSQEETSYKLTTERVRCLDTSGQAFAIILNALYLGPLAYLFIRFFIRTYLTRAKSEPPKPPAYEDYKKTAQEAVKTIEEKVKEAMTDTQDGTTEPPEKLNAELEYARKIVMEITEDANEITRTNSKVLRTKVQKNVEVLKEKVKTISSKTGDKGKENGTKNEASGATDNLYELAEEAKKEAGKSKGKTETAADSTSADQGIKAEDAADDAKQATTDNNDAVKARGLAAREKAANGAEGSEGNAKDAVNHEKSEKQMTGDEMLDELEKKDQDKKPDEEEETKKGEGKS